jgi:UDP-N-acetylmuramoylalanine--D-glutamate ligase
MAAIALSFGHFDDKLLSDVAKEFSGLEHRRELVISDGGVDYYNSSIDSSPKRCVNTLNTFSERVVLILGGRSKGLDFSELVPTAINKARKIILTGEASPEIERAFLENKDYENSGVKLFKVPDFYDAIDFAMKIAEPGECVLLSPAATSYDAFRNFEERGRAFKDYIKKRKNKGT